MKIAHSSSPDAVERNIAIVGAGFSGAMTAVHLLRNSKNTRLNIYLIDASGVMGRGLAYQFSDDNFLLNVPTGNMSAFPDRPTDFTEYCQSIDPVFMSGSFVSRRIYGEYLEHTLHIAERESLSKLIRLNLEVTGIHKNKSQSGWQVSLADGKVVFAEQLVLALGHFSSQVVHPFSESGCEGHYVNNPWKMHPYVGRNDIFPTVLLGTGHTAIDTLFRLNSANPANKLILISRRGLLPNEHRFSAKLPLSSSQLPAYLVNCSPDIRAYVKAIRQEIHVRAAAGVDWRDVLNEMRPHTPELWRRLSTADRKRFLSRISPYWDVNRHRMAPAAHARLKKLIVSGQVRIIAGRINNVTTYDEHIGLEIQMRGLQSLEEIHAQRVVNCTGPNYDLSKVDRPLIRQLLQDDLITQDPLKIGIEINNDYQILKNDQSVVKGLFYVGPMLKAKYWEAIAVPELRGHVAKLAGNLLKPGNAKATVLL